MIIQYDVVLPPSPPSASGKPSADSVPACHMLAAARKGDYKLILLSNDSGTLFYNVHADPTESHPLGESDSPAQRKALEAMLEQYGREARPAHLPPPDALDQGGSYNISACGPEGSWPMSSGVWVPWRSEPLAGVH